MLPIYAPAAVVSVAGRIGAVTLAQADISGLTTADSPTFAGLGIGTASPIGKFEVQTDGATQVSAYSVYSNTASHEPLFYFRKGRGNLASPAPVQDGDILGTMRWAGQFSTTVGQYTTGAKIEGIARGTFTSTNTPTDIAIYTTPTSSATHVERLRIRGSGNVGIMTTAPDRALEVNSATGINLRLTFNDANGSAANYTDLLTASDGGLTLKSTGTIIQLPSTRTTDAAAKTATIHAGHAYAQATGGNLVGANLNLAAGIGAKKYTVVDYTLLAGDTATITVDGTATVRTEGVNWTAATSNNATATSLASAIDALAGVTAVAVAADVFVTPDDSTHGLTIASGDGTNLTVTSSAKGNIVMLNLPTSDPTVAGALWSNAGVLTVSAG